MQVINGSKLKGPSTKVQLEVIHVRHLLRTIFVRKTACQKYFFQILSPQNAQILNLKTLDLDLIRRIQPECGFYEFMICFWICPKTRKIPFWIQKSGFGFPRKTHPEFYLRVFN